MDINVNVKIDLSQDTIDFLKVFIEDQKNKNEPNLKDLDFSEDSKPLIYTGVTDPKKLVYNPGEYNLKKNNFIDDFVSKCMENHAIQENERLTNELKTVCEDFIENAQVESIKILYDWDEKTQTQETSKPLYKTVEEPDLKKINFSKRVFDPDKLKAIIDESKLKELHSEGGFKFLNSEGESIEEIERYEWLETNNKPLSEEKVTEEEPVIVSKPKYKRIKVGERIELNLDPNRLPFDLNKLNYVNIFKKYNESPFAYTGSKYDLLDQLKPHFPKDINTFHDIFCGGLSVTLNVDAKNYIANDNQTYLIDFYKYIKITDKNKILDDLVQVLTNYDITLGDQHIFNAFRAEYNNDRDPLKLYLLACISFSNQIKFSKKKLEFNATFGQRGFTKNDYRKLNNFIDIMKTKDVLFTAQDFSYFTKDLFKEDDFVFLDSPYLHTNVAYSIGLWNETTEAQYYNWIDKNLSHTRFMITNTLTNKNIKNEILEKWLSDNPHLKVIDINNSFHNSLVGKKKTDYIYPTREVMIINY